MRRKLTSFRSIAVAAGFALLSSVSAQEPTTLANDSATWSFQWENDLFAKGRYDRYYTNGLRLVYSRAPLALRDTRDERLFARYSRWSGGLLCSFTGCDVNAAAVALDTHGGQNMYTPQNLRRSVPSPYDRPYAGWLYLGNRTRLADLPDDTMEASRQQALDLVIGVVGRSAGAGKVQEEWHHLVNAIDPQGWSYQLKTEPTIQISYTRTKRVVLGSLFDALPYGRLTAGNVFTHAAIGTQLRWGRSLRGFGHFDPAPSAVPYAFVPFDTPSVEASRRQPRDDSPLYAFVSVEGRAVARNLFIDGNTFRNYPEVSYIQRRPLVGDVTIGFSARVWGTARVTYGHTWRSAEFKQRRPPPEEPRPATQRYGVIQIQWET